MFLRTWTNLILGLFASLAVIYLLPFISTLFFFHEMPHIDTNRSEETVFREEPKFVVYARDKIDPRADNLILLGPSNVREGLSLPELKGIPNEWQVHSLAVGASNITEVKQIVHLLQEYPLREPGGRVAIALGLFYGMFVDNQTRWHGSTTQIETEQVRYRLYERTTAGTFPSLPTFAIPMSLRFIHHSLRIGQTISNLGLLLDNLFPGAPVPTPPPSLAQRKLSPPIVDEKKRKEALDFWNEYMDPHKSILKTEQFVELESLAKEILDRGWSLALIDMPLPRWHWERSRFFRDYQQRKVPFIDNIVKHPRASYINIQDLDEPNTFYDSAHPVPRFTHIWGERVGGSLGKFLSGIYNVPPAVQAMN